jgi:hypothetical protein
MSCQLELEFRLEFADSRKEKRKIQRKHSKNVIVARVCYQKECKNQQEHKTAVLAYCLVLKKDGRAQNKSTKNNETKVSSL